MKTHINNLVVLKIGGNAITDVSTLQSLAKQSQKLIELNYKLIIVHGGGPYIEKVLDENGIQSVFVEGQRKTTPEMMRYVETALSGIVNGDIVNTLQQNGLKSVGISGKDGYSVIVKKRYHLKDDKKYDIGRVGDVVDVNPDLINSILSTNAIPVISPVSCDIEGNTYNVNADNFAGAIAASMKSNHLFFVSNIDGLLMDVSDRDSLIKQITVERAQSLYGSVIQGGMIPKVEACLYAIRNGVEKVHIVNSAIENSIIEKIQNVEAIGTTFVK